MRAQEKLFAEERDALRKRREDLAARRTDRVKQQQVKFARRCQIFIILLIIYIWQEEQEKLRAELEARRKVNNFFIWNIMHIKMKTLNYNAGTTTTSWGATQTSNCFYYSCFIVDISYVYKLVCLQEEDFFKAVKERAKDPVKLLEEQARKKVFKNLFYVYT